ncbi:MAG: FAD-dependent oxidoreductase, partial [Desulfobacterales bacterium]|nr:FAD-dependent oxidoreductase [Desulfobacterales bacterium]
LYKNMSGDGDRIMITLTIDNKSVIAKEGQTVLEAAISAGTYIPNLCYHPNINPIGSCRLCIVEIEGVKGYPISCYMKVSEGMIIKTNTEKLQNLRKNITWLILSNYPKEIPLNSQLKKVIDYVGVNNILINFVPKARDLPIFSGDPLFTRDLNRCILCGRCVIMCQEVRGVGAIGLINRGINTVIGTSRNISLLDAGCKFCRACVEVCPSGALVDKVKINKPETDLIPCKNNCPAGTDIPRYVRLIAEGRFQDSIEVIRQKFPFPHSIGLVCNHPCEEKCNRLEINNPISIRELKRLVAEKDNKRWKTKLRIAADTGKKVAVIGGGPAGLTAAWFLRTKGHKVTVFEALPKPGGMLKAGIPDYRLPSEVLEKEINDITDIEIEIKTNTRIDSIEDLFNKGYDSVFLATGAHRGIRMGITGEDDLRVLDGISTLRKINFNEKVDVKGHVGVVGGGNVAIDVARSALRVGAEKVLIVYRRTKEEMPAYTHEVEDAVDEGVEILFLTNPQRVISDSDKIKVECVKMKLGEADESGRRRPIPIKGSEFILELDRLIIAIGQQSDISSNFGVEVDKYGQITADGETLETSRKG